MRKLARRLAADRRGVTAIEYGLIAAFIALAMVAVLPNVSTSLSNKFQSVANSLQ
jgi:pilus assembly protein Flp/PilA